MPSNSQEISDIGLRHTLNQRAKELSFLYDLSDLLNRSELTQAALSQAVVDRIVTAYEYPDITCARLNLFEQTYITGNFVESSWQQHSSVMVNGAVVGWLTVGHLNARPAASSGPFLNEERSLIDQCARQFGQTIERRQAQTALREREQLLSSIMASLPDIICTVDSEGIVGYINHSTAGNAVEDVIGRPVTDFVFPESHQAAHEAVQHVLASCETLVAEIKGVDPKGATACYELRLTPLCQRKKNDQILLIAKDISEQKATQDRMKDSEDRYRSLFESSMDAVLLSNPEGKISAANGAACALFGWTEEEMCKVGRAGMVDFTDPRLMPALDERARTGYFRGVLTFVRKDGSRFQGEVSSSIFVDSAGEVHASLFLRDITDKLRAEQALAEQAAYYRQAIDAAGAIAYQLDYATNRYNFISPQIERLTGYPADEITSERLGNLVISAIPRGQFAGLPPELALALSLSGECDPVWECDYHIRTDTNDERWLSDASVQIRDETGKPTGTIGIMQDITERVQAEAVLRASEEKYRLLSEELEQRVQTRTAELQQQRDFAQQVMDALGEGLAITDDQRRVVYINPFLANLLEMDPAAMVGRAWVDFLPPEMLALAQNSFGTDQPDQSYHREAHWRTASGKDVSVLVSTTPNWCNDEVSGRITVFTDLTEIKKIEDDLRIANAALERAVHLKDEFLANMSHELRTPLTGILVFSEVLHLQELGPLNERQLRAVNGIHESGEHLLSLINDVLDVAKLEAAQLELQMEPSDVGDICIASLSLVRGMAQSKQQHIDFAIAPPSIQLYADPRRVKQMLVNLLSNAVKFTPPSGRLGLRVQGDEAEQAVRFIVWDEGIGIAAEKLDALFQPFVQIDSSLSRLYSGTGLGLALVKRMVELHGGTVKVESVLGAGSTFTLALPWRQAEPTGTPSVAADAPISEAPHQVEAARILLADDEKYTAEFLADYLAFQGSTVVIAHNGLEAVAKAHEFLPDLILMDIRMPLLDGFQAIALIRASDNPKLSKVPIIAVTAQAMYDDDERCIAAGADAYIAKPYRLADIVGAIQEQLRRRAQ